MSTVKDCLTYHGKSPDQCQWVVDNFKHHPLYQDNHGIQAWVKASEEILEETEQTMREFIYDSWNGVMNAKHNPLRHIQDLQVRHFVLQVLAWMWCIVFALMVSSWTVFE